MLAKHRDEVSIAVKDEGNGFDIHNVADLQLQKTLGRLTAVAST